MRTQKDFRFEHAKQTHISLPLATMAATTAASVTIAPGSTKSLVVVRYYLDRPGYDLQNSSSRFWKDPPAIVTATDVANFLHQQGIKSKDDTGMLVEIYLDRFGSFMWLDVCQENSVHFDFPTATLANPGILNIRLTDLNDLQSSTAKTSAPVAPQRCNTSPVGLFAFSFTVLLETLNILRKLVDGSVDDSYLLVWSPYAFFVSGLLQLIVGLNEITRNNVYGATAFLAFGSFWLANGTKNMLTTYFPDEINDSFLIGSGNVDTCVREVWIMLFACALFKQTLAMNMLTSGVVALLIAYLFSGSVAPWSEAFEWIRLILGFALSLYAFFLFYVELTNEVYHRKVYNLYPWSETSPEEVFGAAGRMSTLQHKALELRTAGRPGALDGRDASLRTSAFHTHGAVHDVTKDGH
jgi:succinate-acetate transporter protein